MISQSQNLPDDSFAKLRDRVYHRLIEDKIDDKIFEVVKGAFEKSLKSEHIILSRFEKNRLLHDILKTVLADILERL